jgi:pilus assembly protein Flp/PilA
MSDAPGERRYEGAGHGGTRMNQFYVMISRFDPRRSRSALRFEGPGDAGQTLIEYALILTLIALVVLGVLTLLGGQVSGFFNSLRNDL